MKTLLGLIFLTLSFVLTDLTVNATEDCVNDVTPPVIEGAKDIYYQIGDPIPDLEKDLIVTDNCWVKLTSVNNNDDYEQAGIYKVHYYAQDLNENITTKIVNLHVHESITSPVIVGDFELFFGVLNPLVESDYLAGIQAFDFRDYDISNQITVNHYDTVNYNILGIYPITYQVIDLLNQKTTVPAKVHIIDQEAPVVMPNIDKLILNVYDPEPDYRVYFDVTDNYEKKETLTLEIIENVDVDTIGSYVVTMIATDTSNNQIETQLDVQVADITPPVISGLKNFEIYLDGMDSMPNYLEGIGAMDNYDGIIPTSKIRYDDSWVDYEKEGVYPLNYLVSDKSGMMASKTVFVYIKDQEKPVITGIEPITIPNSIENKCWIDLLEGVVASDNLSGDLTIDVDDTNVDYSVPGSYYINYTVIDLSGNSDIQRTTITVYEDTLAPVIKGAKDLEIEVGSAPIDLKEGITAQDNYAQPLDMVVSGTVNYNVIGAYDINYTVWDLSGNKAEQTITINIKDTQAPIVTTEVIQIEVGSKKPSYYDSVVASDNYSQLKDLVINCDDLEVDLSILGVYQVKVTVTDTSGNITTKLLEVRVVDTIAPVITGVKNSTIKKGDKINLFKGIKAVDNYDGDVSAQVKIEGKYSLTKKGTYPLTVKVTDSSGNVSRASFILTVKSGSKTWLVVTSIVVLTGVTATVGWVYYTKKKY